MDYGIGRHSMNDDFADEIITSPKQAKSLMWYVGCIITAGVIGITVMLFLMEGIFV
jgi:hypothetical protein